MKPRKHQEERAGFHGRRNRVDSIRAGAVGVGLMILGILLSVACHSTQVKDAGAPGATIQRYHQSVRIALADREANPEDPGVQRNLVRALLDAREYPVAYEEAQRLRGLEPDEPENIELLGHACFGLGLFQEAASCFYKVWQQAPATDAAWWLAYILAARGDTEDARQVLLSAFDQASPEWRVARLLVDVTPSYEERVRIVEAYRARFPGNEEAALLDAALHNQVDGTPHGRIIAGEGEVLRAHLSDYYKVSIKINGYKVLARFAMGRSGLLLSRPAVTDLALDATGVPGPLIRGIGGKGVVDTETVMLQSVELGNVVLEDVPALLVEELHTADIVAVIGSDLLPGYSYRLDRKNELLTMFPPTYDMPEPSGSSWIQHYYQFDDLVVTDAAIRNRTSGREVKVKVALETDTENTLLNLDYASSLEVGIVDTTRTVQAKGITGYHKAVFVSFTEIVFGGNRFLSGGARQTMSGTPLSASGDFFLAAELDNLGTFIPFAVIGRDILRYFMITVDKQRHKIILDTYER